MKKNYIPRGFGGFFRLISLVTSVFTLMFFTSCEEPDEIGMDLVENPLSLSTEVYEVTAYSVPEDSVPTNFSTRNLLGFFNDPVFGSTRTSIYTEFRLTADSLFLGEDPILDSVVLELYYAGYYGNYTTFQNVKVYELSENFPEPEDGAFYSTLVLEHKETPVVDIDVRPTPDDSVAVGHHTYPPHLRIRLSDDTGELGKKLIDASGTEHFYDNDAFREFFKGLYVTVDMLPPDEDGAILYFNLLRAEAYESNSTIRLYYHQEGDTISSTWSFPASESKRATNAEQFGYENAHEYLKKQIIESETSYGDSLLFLQSMAGVNVFIDFQETLESLAKEENVVINRAKLIIPVDLDFTDENYYSEEHSPPPGRLYLLKKDEDGDLAHIIDSNFGYFDGWYDEDEKEYRMNITQHFQQLLEDPGSNYGMILVIAESHSNANRVVLKGPGREENPLRLELNYINLE